MLDRLELRRFDGGLVDLPRAPLPDPETPAPPRFLPTWDATLLVHARRTGILPEEHRPKIFGIKTPHSFPTFLIDGQVAGTWRYERRQDRARAVRQARRRGPAGAEGGGGSACRASIPERLSALDASFLAVESPLAPMHVGWVASFDPPDDGPTTAEELIAHIAARMEGAHRYRQKLADVPLGVHDPVWVDDPDFDPARHLHAATGDVAPDRRGPVDAARRATARCGRCGSRATRRRSSARPTTAWSTASPWSSSAT